MSKWCPRVMYQDLKIDMDLNMEKKVARLHGIMMEMSNDRVDLHLAFSIRDAESGAATITQSNRTGGKRLYNGLQKVEFWTQFGPVLKQKEFAYFWFTKQDANDKTV